DVRIVAAGVASRIDQEAGYRRPAGEGRPDALGLDPVDQQVHDRERRLRAHSPETRVTVRLPTAADHARARPDEGVSGRLRFARETIHARRGSPGLPPHAQSAAGRAFEREVLLAEVQTRRAEESPVDLENPVAELHSGAFGGKPGKQPLDGVAAAVAPDPQTRGSPAVIGQPPGRD